MSTDFWLVPWFRMSPVTTYRLAILELASAFAMIMIYIWEFHHGHRHLWLGILGLMMLSHWFRRERAITLGFQVWNLRECLQEFAPALAFLALLLLASSILLQTTRRIRFDDAFLAWAAYLPRALLQQYALNGYFLNRLEAVASRRHALVISASLFSGAHAPNWFLMGITFLGGYCSTRIYRRYNNLYFLALAHATVGFLVFLAIPDSISHHLDIGPGWFRR